MHMHDIPYFPNIDTLIRKERQRHIQVLPRRRPVSNEQSLLRKSSRTRTQSRRELVPTISNPPVLDDTLVLQVDFWATPTYRRAKSSVTFRRKAREMVKWHVTFEHILTGPRSTAEKSQRGF